MAAAALFAAVMIGDEARVSELLAEGSVTATQRNALQETPLMRAAGCGRVGILHVLLRAGANVHAYDASENTALVWAVQNGHLAAVCVLVAAGAVVDTKNREGCTPLMLAVHKGHADVARELLRAGANVDEKDYPKLKPQNDAYVLAAMGLGPVHVALALAAATPAVFSVSSCSCAGSGGRTALAMAAQRGDNELVRELLQAGASVNAKDELGATPLELAARRRHWSTAELLIVHGGSVDFSWLSARPLQADRARLLAARAWAKREPLVALRMHLLHEE